MDKTVVVGGRDTRAMTLSEIDDYVKSRLAAGADLHTLHAGPWPDWPRTPTVARSASDLVFTQTFPARSIAGALPQQVASPFGVIDAGLDPGFGEDGPARAAAIDRACS